MSMRRTISVYVLLYGVLAAADLGSTLLGHSLADAAEFNPVMAKDSQLDVRRFIALNVVIGAVCTAMLIWALGRGERVEPTYMRSPWRAALTWLTYMNPFAARNVSKAVFHWIAIPISLLLVRAFAVGNNLLISFQLPDVLTPLTRWIMPIVPSALVYPIVATILMAPFWIGSLYLVRRVLEARGVGSPSHDRLQAA